MKTLPRWMTISLISTIALSTATAALSQTINIKPDSATIQVAGTSGGTQADGCAGKIAAAPNHVVQVTEDVNLSFTLQAAGQPALLIRSETGKNFCVPADSLSGGTVKIPGRWTKGNYSVFVGDRASGQHPYTLSISRN